MKNVVSSYPWFEEGSKPDIFGDYPESPNWRLITELSGQMYEKQQCNAAMAFIEDGSQIEKKFTLKFNDPIDFNRDNLRLIRKHLQTTDQNHVLMVQAYKSDDGKVLTDRYGNKSMKATGIYLLENKLEENMLLVKITEHMVWHAEKQGEFLFEYKDGYFDEENPEDKFKEKINQAETCYKNLFNKQCEWLHPVIKVLKATKHGAVIVIHEEAINEANRLTSPNVGHGTKLKAQKNYGDNGFKQMIRLASKIDGGFLFDKNGNLVAYGVVFDGTVPNDAADCDTIKYGNPARGSRYNSLLLYTILHRDKCMAIVFSDDLSIDILPPNS